MGSAKFNNWHIYNINYSYNLADIHGNWAQKTTSMHGISRVLSSQYIWMRYCIPGGGKTLQFLALMLSSIVMWKWEHPKNGDLQFPYQAVPWKWGPGIPIFPGSLCENETPCMADSFMGTVGTVSWGDSFMGTVIMEDHNHKNMGIPWWKMLIFCMADHFSKSMGTLCMADLQ